jgi:threonine synthase
MEFLSTRRDAPRTRFGEAVLRGLAPDGGLFVPENFPQFDPADFTPDAPFAETAARVLRRFMAGDPLESDLPAICSAAFDFPLPLRHLQRATAVLELFHGPTAAFKDFGARFLAECLERSVHPSSEGMTVLVATSGDTGSAVASAFHRRPGIRVGILYPEGGVSPRQESQLTCWDDNVRSFAVRGSFDDCQRLVKQAFLDESWSREAGLTSANSINVGRLLPQAAYYAAASLRYTHDRGTAAGFIVPAGNLGNAVGAFWARRMGFPLREIALPTNANRVIPHWFETQEWRPRPSVRTLANAMDVGDPSNMERLFDMYEDRAALLDDASALSVDDDTIRRTIADGPARWGEVWCPHTATAAHFREQLDSPDWVIAATAHPAKFDDIVEPLIGRTVDVPAPLAGLLARPRNVLEIDADLTELKRGMR